VREVAHAPLPTPLYGAAMSIGGIFLLIACIVFVLLSAGVVAGPRVEYLAFASLALGILLAGIPLPLWPGR
jgi:hypothetical protein